MTTHIKPFIPANEVSPTAIPKPKNVIPFTFRALGVALNLASIVSQKWAAKRLDDLWFTAPKQQTTSWKRDFWHSADRRLDITFGPQQLPVYLWGHDGPIVVLMHGWGGSGFQFRRFIPPLVSAGYQVVCFNAPAHGNDPQTQTNVKEFAQCLLAIQHKLGKLEAVIAHSLGAMATLVAAKHDLYPKQLILIAPALDVEDALHNYSQALQLNQRLRRAFKQQVGASIANIMGSQQVWEYFSAKHLLANLTPKGLIIFDHDDTEINPQQFQHTSNYWPSARLMATKQLGHFNILKDPSVIQACVEQLTGLNPSAPAQSQPQSQ